MDVIIRQHTARKEHKCWLCGYTIHPGTRYARRVTLHPGVGVHDGAEHTWCGDAARGPVGLWDYDEAVDEDPGEFRRLLVEAGVVAEDALRAWCEEGPHYPQPPQLAQRRRRRAPALYEVMDAEDERK